MAILDTAKTIAELAKKGMSVELQEKIMELREEVIALKEENIQLRNENLQLKQNLLTLELLNKLSHMCRYSYV